MKILLDDAFGLKWNQVLNWNIAIVPVGLTGDLTIKEAPPRVDMCKIGRTRLTFSDS